MGIAQDISTIKERYREFFQLAHQRLEDLFKSEQSGYACNVCPTPPALDAVLHPGCGYSHWQRAMIPMLEQTIGKQILDSLERINAAKEVKGACHSCGVCCSLASSEFDYAQLQDKAAHGDDFARQFTSVFLPYASTDAAHDKFPAIVSEILAQTEGDGVHFYYCPHLDENNRCSIYTDPRRPQLCADYPATPLTLMYKNCGYQPWKTETLPTTLMAHAALELCHYYAQKILAAVKAGEAEPV